MYLRETVRRDQRTLDQYPGAFKGINPAVPCMVDSIAVSGDKVLLWARGDCVPVVTTVDNLKPALEVFKAI